MAETNDSKWSEELSDRYSVEWKNAINIVRNRFNERYFDPIDEMIKHERKEIRTRVGFIIMSIDCLLIETLNQFLFGIEDTNVRYNRSNPDNNFKYNSQAFRDFFNYSTYFPVFKSTNGLSKIFYDEIRCGLLHQAQTKTNSLINIKSSDMVRPVDKQDFNNGIEINRNLFHYALQDEYNKYFKDLQDPESKNLDGEYLRDMCNRKMKELIK
ncbi:hypothetical protein DSM03_106182 [Leeuwenhoekiella aestuarii]|uniref:Uncharacterized protein n=1 Tax=Leeuwenhoekiella aestuarii TaxID=2249426 RepID=A0A4Q0NQP5_9FLAO|nr:hypothetical protein [Leeuwenhoekiella aestuarii]RXG12412.1 hypothetical protein DSM04_107183 [Leeuwenhoekiella aestuarii]RXG13844.1 hypothetical protein DSM03_106182 [Leeuwenhoekiella aestuarii]